MGCMGMGWGVLSGWPATEETPAGRDISGLLCGSAVIMSRQIASSDNIPAWHNFCNVNRFLFCGRTSSRRSGEGLHLDPVPCESGLVPPGGLVPDKDWSDERGSWSSPWRPVQERAPERLTLDTAPAPGNELCRSRYNSSPAASL